MFFSTVKRVTHKRIILTWLAIILAAGLVAGDFLAMTTAYCTDIETASGNSFEAWSASLWTQTDQADFEAGVTNQVDTTSISGSVKLAQESSSSNTTIADDDFESGDGSGGSGWLWEWWMEGDAAVTTNGTPHGGSYHLRLMSTDDYVDRALDLTGQTSVHLQFWAKADGFEAASYAQCAINDGSVEDTVASWSEGDDDNTYHFYDIDLSGYDMSSEFYVTFYADLSGADDYLYIDDIAFVSTEGLAYYSSGTVASQVLDTGAAGTTWDGLFWDETLPGDTDITFEVRASDTLFAKDDATPSWNAVGGTSPVISGLPSGRYLQWRATLATSDTDNTPILLEVRVYYY